MLVEKGQSNEERSNLYTVLARLLGDMSPSLVATLQEVDRLLTLDRMDEALRLLRSVEGLTARDMHTGLSYPNRHKLKAYLRGGRNG